MNKIYHQSEETLFGRVVEDYLLGEYDFFTEKVVHEFEDRYIVEVQVPGFLDRELELNVEDDVIVLKGFNLKVARKFVFKRVSKSLIFQRSFLLPIDAASNTISARYQPGLLQIICLRQMIPFGNQRHYLVQRRRVKISNEKYDRLGFGYKVKMLISRILTFESTSA